jgi:uncharacterized protein YuzE
MKICYDRETDTLVIALRDERIKESEEVRPGVIVDFGYDGGIVRFEILEASPACRRSAVGDARHELGSRPPRGRTARVQADQPPRVKPCGKVDSRPRHPENRPNPTTDD